MFSSTGILRGIRCPNGEQCSLTNCIFAHGTPSVKVTTDAAVTISSAPLQDGSCRPASPPPAKRRRLDTAGSQNANSLHGASSEFVYDRPAKLQDRRAGSTPIKSSVRLSVESNLSKDTKLSSTVRPVSPPPTSDKVKTGGLGVRNGAVPRKAEDLNPRMVPNDPAGHNKRLIYLGALHKEMQRLNEQVGEEADVKSKSLELGAADLIKRALDEEEKFAREQASVYANVIKLQIVKYRKMPVSDWIALRHQEEVEKSEADPMKGKVIEIGLSAAEEVSILRRMITDQEGIDQWGYVTSPPTEKDIEAARAGLEAAGGYEECDRCKTRFQVFPDRREDGELTSGGKCMHHWGRPYYPKKAKTDAVRGPAEPRYTCCNEVLGTKGCSESPTHVYKISEAKRLAAVLPFETTPGEVKSTTFDAVCFDCEMGYTVYGLELIRLTAVSWPKGNALLDVLVRPLGAILDLNTRFSGVTQEQISKAQELNVKEWRNKIASVMDEASPNDDAEPSETLKIVSSPAVARQVLTDLVGPQTLLVGHALENDLNSVRLVHPQIVDTVFLFPHARGLPYRYGLRHLAQQFLDRSIQAAGAAGHSSLEDARATGDVARYKVKKEWERLRLDGWTVRDGEFFAPGEVLGEQGVPGLPNYKDHASNPDTTRKKKRKKSGGPGQLDGSDETAQSGSD